jgi:prepilin-type N-terminal cleavage/methylation domain-containing protein
VVGCDVKVRAAADAGMTVLELLVVLAIGAVAVTLVVASLPRGGGDDRHASEELVALLANARVEAAASGKPVVVTVAPGAMSDGNRSVSWGSDVGVVVGDGAAQGRVVFHGDGSMAGEAVRILVNGETMSVTSPDRPPS